MKLAELPKAYEPQQFEAEIYKLWEESGYFNPDNIKADEYFSIIMPPPNTTGVLHLGHASSFAYEDLMVRYARLQGKKTLYLPGTDHAAIATQSRMESILAKEGLTRHDLGREDFIARTKKYVEETQGTIKKQIRVMGASCDWSRERYTFSPESSRAVNEVFAKMYNDGLIYRGDRIVNWDTKLQTNVSDDELNWQEETGPFYYFKYGPFEIGTSRPETKFGDKYVVVHPDDERYENYKAGQTIELEWINGPITATVIKDQAIDMTFGTGAMTITPWHDATDFEIAERHKLDKEQIIDFNGNLMEIAGEFAGLNIEEARPKIVAKLKAKGLLTRVEENYQHRVARSDRGNVVVEPQIRRQWFVDVNKEIPGRGKSLKQLTREAVANGAVKLIPQHFDKIYFSWIDNLRDWCISRQIWWGHRIPVWYCNDCHNDPEKYKKGEYWMMSLSKPKICQRCGKDNMHQDNDTLDTWFSSALWTFSTLLDKSHLVYNNLDDWIKNSPDLKYHPTSVMETGYDIIFFWVARMIMMSYYVMEEKPFEEVYLHGLIRDEQGRKMSKSLDNGIDPIAMSNKYGTDALRLALVIGSSPGNDLRLYDGKIAGYRNFVNKLWNISRFILTTVNEPKLVTVKPKLNSLADKWIWSEYAGTIKEVTNLIDAKMFSLAAERLYDFTWSKLADWYLEVVKIENKDMPVSKPDRDSLLLYMLKGLLIMWHPFTPFVTELLWQQLNPEKPLLVASWPKEDFDKDDYLAVAQFEKLQELATAIRNARAENKVLATEIVDVAYFGQNGIEEIESVIEKLARVRFVKKTKGLEIKGSWFRLVLGFEGNKQDLEKVKSYIEKLEKKLADKSFIDNAPSAIVEAEKKKLEEAQAKLK